MNELAYDINYLIDSESAEPVAPLRVASTTPAAVAPSPANVAGAQEALARELLQAAATHEALIQQYLRFSGGPSQGAFSQ